MTPAERRKNLIDAVAGTSMAVAVTPIEALDNLLMALDNHEDPNERALGQMLRNGVEEIPDAGWKADPDYDGTIVSSGHARRGRPQGTAAMYRIAEPASPTEEEK